MFLRNSGGSYSSAAASQSAEIGASNVKDEGFRG